MIKLIVSFKYFDLKLKIGYNKNVDIEPSKEVPPPLTEEGENEYTPPGFSPPLNYDDGNNEYGENNTSKEDLSYLDVETDISKMAKQYEDELNNGVGIVVPPPYKTGADVKMNGHLSAPFCLPKTVEGVDSTLIPDIRYEGLYDIGDTSSDYMAEEFKDYPVVEMVTDDYEIRLQRSMEMANQRYMTYKDTHEID